MNHFEFVEKYGIESDAVRVSCRPDGLNDSGDQIHWLVVLSAGDNEEAFFFSHGFNWLPEGKDAHPWQLGYEEYPGEIKELRNTIHRLNDYGKSRLKGAKYHKPDTVSVIYSLQMDSVIVEDTTDMWDFFEQFGIEPTKKGALSYELIVRNVDKLKQLLGSHGYEMLLRVEEE